jgi:hypothetical protein
MKVRVYAELGINTYVQPTRLSKADALGAPQPQEET